MSSYKVFVLKGALNEATQYYINIIRQAIESRGHTSEIVFRPGQIKAGDRIILIDAKTFFLMFFLKPFNVKITWFQGVVPEEARMVFNSFWREWLWRIFEWMALRFSRFNFFVSNAMHAHYRHTYNYQKHNYTVMPCFNAQLNKQSFLEVARYQQPSFVYAGNMNQWQCIDLTLRVFAGIEKRFTEASLVLLTADTEKANTLLKKYQIRNARTSFCPLEKINLELSRYKYGFILRDDHIVNRVATPTKMSTYLANGVIPVYTNVVEDFKDALAKVKNKIPVSAVMDADEISKAVIAFEQNHSVLPHEVFKDFENVFDSYFNKDKYLAKLALRIDEIELKTGK